MSDTETVMKDFRSILGFEDGLAFTPEQIENITRALMVALDDNQATIRLSPGFRLQAMTALNAIVAACVVCFGYLSVWIFKGLYDSKRVGKWLGKPDPSDVQRLMDTLTEWHTDSAYLEGFDAGYAVPREVAEVIVSAPVTATCTYPAKYRWLWREPAATSTQLGPTFVPFDAFSEGWYNGLTTPK